ncbi:uncharacterized protein STEHIDRAFT_120660 [Stereum hirsutum FP-91666 SS1]|uniref:uncharacterized protein n=1 Tax=Stereum hirsutum (strain FP-91666) TaxID=721885 RepID=UPI000440E2CE|nr:uncharacterized protein STEHIDRAFT_120660 [Stereum hirsutum FP-91666 SS1]EIM88497.1 hypothetical protein STEHIDRAFT_120660 [Stereum hirsutum FP-91666 SS1]
MDARDDGISASKALPPPPLPQAVSPPGPSYETATLSVGARLAVFTALALPVTLLPFITLRRQLLSLHRKTDEIRAATNVLQRELKGTLVELSVKKEEHLRMKEMLEEARQKLEATRRDTHRLQLSRLADEKEYQRRLQEIMESTSFTQSQLAHLRELGPSLADIAAFMQEVEIQQGYTSPRKQDGRGIERLRRVALQLEEVIKDPGPKAH